MDIIDRNRRSRLMGRIRGKDTKPELIVRRLAHSLGYRFRLHRVGLPGRPDLVFPRYRTVVFVHGCFWHRHPGCPCAAVPKTRPEFWAAKFVSNVARDARNQAELRKLGWSVVVLWECEVEKPHFVAKQLHRALRAPVSSRNLAKKSGSW